MTVANIIGRVPLAKERTMRRWRVTHVRSITGSALTVSRMIRRREFMRKRTVVLTNGGAPTAITATVFVTTRIPPVSIAGVVPKIKRDIPSPNRAVPAIGTAPIATAVRVTLQMRYPSVNTRGIARIVNTGIRSPMVVQRGGTAPSATMKTRYVRLKARRIALIRGTARRAKKGIYLRNRVRKVSGTAKPATPFIIPPATMQPFRTSTPGTALSTNNIPGVNSGI